MKKDRFGRREIGSGPATPVVAAIPVAKKPEDKAERPAFAGGSMLPAEEAPIVPIGRAPAPQQPVLSVAPTPVATPEKVDVPADPKKPDQNQVATVIPGATIEPSLGSAWADEDLPVARGAEDGADVIEEMAAHPPGAARPPKNSTNELDDGQVIRDDALTPGPEEIGQASDDPLRGGNTIREDVRPEPEGDVLTSSDMSELDAGELGGQGAAPERDDPNATLVPTGDEPGAKVKRPSDDRQEPHKWLIAIGALLFAGGVAIGIHVGRSTKKEKVVFSNCDICTKKQAPAPEPVVVEQPKVEAPKPVEPVEPAAVETVTVPRRGRRHAAASRPATEARTTEGCSSVKDADGTATASQVPAAIWRAARIGVDTLAGQLGGKTVQVTYLLCPDPNGGKGVTPHLLSVKGAGASTEQVEKNVRAEFAQVGRNDSGISTVKLVKEDVSHD